MVETRKVQEVGGGTLTVSLPRDWVESVGIEQGDYIELHEHVDGVLGVQPSTSDTDPMDHAEVDVSGVEPAAIPDMARATYASGYESMTFRRSEGFSDDHRREFESVSRLLAGTTIVDASESDITVRVLLDSKEVSICQLLRQLRFVAVSLYTDAVATLTGDDSSRDVTSHREQICRLVSLIEHVFQRTLLRLDEVDALGRTRPELFLTWTTAHELSHVAEHATRILDAGSDVEPVTDETDLQTIARQTQTVVEDAVSVVLGDRDVSAAREALATSESVQNRLAAVDERLLQTAGAGYRLAVVLNSVRRAAVHGGNIAERAVLANEPAHGSMDDTRLGESGETLSTELSAESEEE